MRLLALAPYLAVVCASILVPCLPALGTSAQIEMTQPVLDLSDRRIHGTAMLGLVLSGDVYNTAGHLGATFPLGIANGGRIYFHGSMFTWIEDTEDADFEPQRIEYTLEPGYYWERGRSSYRAFVKHQSFHDVDSFDGVDESYELYGFSYSSQGNPGYTLSAGRYANRTDVDYEWDLAASVTYCLSPPGGRDPYFHLWLHHVTESDGPTDRDGFTDYAAELGLRYVSGIIVFARYEFLHDIDMFDGTADHHVLTGIRYDW